MQIYSFRTVEFEGPRRRGLSAAGEARRLGWPTGGGAAALQKVPDAKRDGEADSQPQDHATLANELTKQNQTSVPRKIQAKRNETAHSLRVPLEGKCTSRTNIPRTSKHTLKILLRPPSVCTLRRQPPEADAQVDHVALWRRFSILSQGKH